MVRSSRDGDAPAASPGSEAGPSTTVRRRPGTPTAPVGDVPTPTTPSAPEQAPDKENPPRGSAPTTTTTTQPHRVDPSPPSPNQNDRDREPSTTVTSGDPGAHAKDHSGTKPATPPREYNPRSLGYVYILLTSLVNFSATSNLPKTGARYDGVWGVCVAFGVLPFAVSLGVLVHDRTPLGRGVCGPGGDYTTAWEGRFEGYVLVLLSLVTIIGFLYQSQVNGVAYVALNIYFSAALLAASAVYTLNLYGTAKDLLSLKELTGISATLPSWYILFLSSLVVAGTAADTYPHVDLDAIRGIGGLSVALCVGAVSAGISFSYILIHYQCIQSALFTRGSITELLISLGLLLGWIITTAVITQEGGIAPTIEGSSGCPQTTYTLAESLMGPDTLNCTVVAVQESTTNAGSVNVTVTYSCEEVLIASEQSLFPGSNMYLGVWTSLFVCIYLPFRWKAAQALQFAQAQQNVAFGGDATGGRHKRDDRNNDSDVDDSDFDGDIDDDDDFGDAEQY